MGKMGKTITGRKEQKSAKKSKAVISSSNKRSLTATTNDETDIVLPHMERPAPPPPQSLFQNSVMTVAKKSSSKMKMRPSLAAAMLSLPWPPPDISKLVLTRQKVEEAKKKVEIDVESIKDRLQKQDENDNGCANCCNNDQSGKSCCCSTGKATGHVKGRSSKKFCMKKKSKGSVDPRQATSKQQQNIINGDPRRKPGEPYLPVTVPPFKHVHTAWPGFDHAPVPNWKRKYMVAKPWPYQQKLPNARVKFNEKSIQNFPAGSVLLSRPSAQMDLRNSNFSGRSLASIRSPSLSSTAMFIHINKMEGGRSGSDEDISRREIGLPKQRIRLERVGSCIK